MSEIHEKVRTKLDFLVSLTGRAEKINEKVEKFDPQVEETKKRIKAFIYEVSSQNLCMIDLGNAAEIFAFSEGAGRVLVCRFDFRFGDTDISEDEIANALLKGFSYIILDE